MRLDEEDIQLQLSRRRPGQSKLTTARDEKDRVAIQSGTEFGVTLGTPIGLIVQNQDQRPHDYSETDLYPRPSHADWTYLQKYGVKASSGGGRSSARETVGRVAAGAIAEKYLQLAHGVEIIAFVSSVGQIHIPASTSDDSAPFSKAYYDLLAHTTRPEIDASAVRCPDATTADQMSERIMECRELDDSIGGTVTCVIRNVPAGLGEPCFDKMEASLAHAMLSIPATKGFEIGSGFRGCKFMGSQHNDSFEFRDGKMRTITNNSGGVQGGIANGEVIFFRVAFKPPATIAQAQQTSTYEGKSGTLAARGRHDPCVVPRAVPIVESMAALVVMDTLLQQQSRQAARALLPPLKTNLAPSTTAVGGDDALQKKRAQEQQNTS